MRTVYRLAGLFTFLAVAMGSLVCATESGAACPTWPGCYPEQLGPALHLNPLIEFTHRVVAVLAGPLVLAACLSAVFARPRHRDPWVRRLPWVALVGALAAGIFGRLVVLTGIPTWAGVLDLGCALTAMCAMAAATVWLDRPRQPDPSRLSTLAWTAAGALIGMHLLGIVVAGPGSYTRCMGWPALQLSASDSHPWLQGVRWGIAAFVAVTLVTVVRRCAVGPTRRWGQLAAVLFGVEVVLALAIRVNGLTAALAAIYSVAAVALLCCLAIIAALGRTAAERAPVTQVEVFAGQ